MTPAARAAKMSQSQATVLALVQACSIGDTAGATRLVSAGVGVDTGLGACMNIFLSPAREM